MSTHDLLVALVVVLLLVAVIFNAVSHRVGLLKAWGDAAGWLAICIGVLASVLH